MSPAISQPSASVLFLCTGNSCRSQMAEAWCRALHHDRLVAYSAGSIAKGLNPQMLEVMRELGLDPALQQSSKTLQSVLEAGVQLDHIITVCGHAHETCPIFPAGGTRVRHVGFDDPPALEDSPEAAGDRLAPYRRVRDEIRTFILSLPEFLS